MTLEMKANNFISRATGSKTELKLVTTLVLGLGFWGCASNDKVKEVDTKLEVKGAVDSAKVGINDDGVAIVEEKTEADDELRAVQWANTRLLERLETDYAELKRCREDLSDPRLGGTGEVRAIPEIDGMKTIAEVKEEFGLDSDGKLTVVKREKYLDKLAAERKYQATLTKMTKTVEEHRSECQRSERTARVKAGLPAQRYTAQGSFDADGNWRETRKAERTLDDAFEIRGKESAKAAVSSQNTQQ